MCGICGKYSEVGVRPEELRTMLQTIAHRGPDDEGIYVNERIGLGNCRLSIIDLLSGHQPMCNEDETVWIVCNGEIYNYGHLRQELEKNGHVFRTNSDTEVIVHLYEELGEQCVDKLSGMFAFAIWDEANQKLLLARDRIGQKPLFYSRDGGDFLFASEIKAILAVSKQQRVIDYESLHHYLSLRFIPSPGTMLRHIKKFPPAHFLVFQDVTVTISRYWRLSFLEKLDLSETELIENLQEKLTKTIDSHLVSDVPVGAFLSGGLDSSMVVAIMARDLLANAFKTFTVGVEENSFNEIPYARMVAERYKTSHVELQVESNLISLLPKMIWHLDEPSDPIAACQFLAAELAARNVKVVLGGDGGDELFAGFDRYLGIAYVDRYSVLPLFFRDKIIGPLLARVPDTFAYKNITQKLRWVQQLSMFPDTAARYAEATCFFRFSHEDKRSLYGNELWQQVCDCNSSDIIITEFNNAEAEDPIDRMLYADFMTRLPEHSLMLTDRMTMAHGLELRSPYLDHQLVEFMAAFPSDLKIRNRKLKYVLRTIGQDYLPKEILKRKKHGFMFPIAYWFKNELYPFVRDFLLDSHFIKDGLFTKKNVSRLIEEHRNNRMDNHVRLWMLLNIEVWHQIYIEQNAIADVEEGMQDYL
jgi:asparagine synthase (glutamine-hydrolysing)